MKLKLWFSRFSSWRKTPPCSSQTAGFFVLWHQLTLFLCLHCDLIRITWAFSKFDRCCQWGSWVIVFFSNLSLGLLMCSCAFFVCVFVILLVMFGVFTFYSLIDPRRWICYSQGAGLFCSAFSRELDSWVGCGGNWRTVCCTFSMLLLCNVMWLLCDAMWFDVMCDCDVM